MKPNFLQKTLAISFLSVVSTNAYGSDQQSADASVQLPEKRFMIPSNLSWMDGETGSEHERIFTAMIREQIEKDRKKQNQDLKKTNPYQSQAPASASAADPSY